MTDQAYYEQRAQTERRRAATTTGSAAHAHATLADLYRKRAEAEAQEQPAAI